MKTLSEEKLEELLKSKPDWRLVEGALVREWKFPDFVAAMLFVNRIAAAAEAAGHHPDIDIRYNRVRLALISHDAGGITERDAEMINKIDSV